MTIDIEKLKQLVEKLREKLAVAEKRAWQAEREVRKLRTIPVELSILLDRAEKAEKEIERSRAHIESLKDACGKATERNRELEQNEVDRMQQVADMIKERDEAIATLPSSSGRDENRAAEELGEIMRLETGEHSSIGVVEVDRACRVLVYAYAEANTLRRQLIEATNESGEAHAEIDCLKAEKEKLRKALVIDRRQGGRWLGAARTWLQWNTRNGEHITWGSGDLIEPQMTARNVEDLAATVAEAVAHAALFPDQQT